MANADDHQIEEMPSEDDSELEAHLQSRRMMINLGPSHPAMHGTVRMRVELDGETIVRADPEIGFLHRGFQKSCENVTWNQCLPYTDRLNYVSAIMNNLGFLKAVEKLVG
ncbi:MAG TPA: NADH-quinone oxidoreductase subunit D, partial [Myxococcaceae bacterium]|nr:NADH-quinone oxidoreductase subunit D [Myxococcaceae bacterium]